MWGAEAYALEPLEDEDEQFLFMSTLYHDARGGNAVRMLLGEGEGNKPFVSHYANADYKKLEYRSSKYNAYTSVNTFRSFKRASENCFCITSIFIDLDGHNYKTEKTMDAAIEKTKRRLARAYKRGEITPATLLTSTGRGIGVFYTLKSSIPNTEAARKAIKYYEDVRAALTERYRQLLSGTGYLEVDSTVKDHARVCRLPLTVNQKNGRWCRLIHVDRDDEGEVRYCTLKQLAEENHLFDEVNKIRQEMMSRKVVCIDAYKNPFLTLRMKKLELLQELRGFDCAGCREYMLFIHYNCTKQLYGAEIGAQLTSKFNQRFISPLSEAELEKAVRCVDENIPPSKTYEGHYRLKDDWLVESLAVTDEENKVCRFGSSKRQIERQHRKEQNQEKRKNRNKTIAEYIVSHPDQSYPQIAVTFGVSQSTVYRICKEYDIHRANDLGSGVPEIKKNEIETAVMNDVEAEMGASSKNVTEYGMGSAVGERPVPSVAFMLQEAADVASVSVISSGNIARVSEQQEGLLRAYTELYGQVTQKRQKRRQIPGQLGFRWLPDGAVEYYMIS